MAGIRARRGSRLAAGRGWKTVVLAVVVGGLLGLAPVPVLKDDIAAADPSDDYRSAVVGDDPLWYWRLNEQSGDKTITDEMGSYPGEFEQYVFVSRWDLPGIFDGDQQPPVDGDAAAAASGFGTTTPLPPAEQSYSVEMWFRTDPADEGDPDFGEEVGLAGWQRGGGGYLGLDDAGTPFFRLGDHVEWNYCGSDHWNKRAWELQAETGDLRDGQWHYILASGWRPRSGVDGSGRGFLDDVTRRL